MDQYSQEQERNSAKSRHGAQDVVTIVFWVFRLINAAFSYMFGAEYFGPAISMLHDSQWSDAIAGIMFVVVLDAAALAWGYANLHLSRTSKQRQIASAMVNVSMAGSAVATFAQLILSQDLVDLSMLHWFVQVIAVFGISTIIVMHFVQTIRWNAASPENIAQDIEQSKIASWEDGINIRLSERLAADLDFVADRIGTRRRAAMLQRFGLSPTDADAALPPARLPAPDAPAPDAQSLAQLLAQAIAQAQIAPGGLATNSNRDREGAPDNDANP